MKNLNNSQNDLNQNGTTESSASRGDKRPYVTPRLVVHGTLQQLTKAACGGGDDGGLGAEACS